MAASGETGSTTKDVTVNEGSTLESALKDLKFTSNGAKSDADPVSTNYYPANARDIATGNQNTFIIDTSGNLWACGYNDNGQLGDQNNTSGYNSSYPSDAGSLIKVNVVDNGVKVKLKAVAAGESHTLLLDESGNVWTCGNAKSGRIGRNASNSDTSKYYSFEKIAPTENDGAVTIADIAAGYDFSLLLDSNGHVWACGENGAGQLGLGNSSNQSTFTRVTVKDSENNEITFKAMSAGYRHSILLDKNNNVWVAGEGDNGRLGTGSTSDVNTFTKLEITESNGQNTNAPVEFAAVSAGIDHSLLIDSNGSVWACGNNSKGQLGLGNNNSQSTFTKIDTQGVKFTQVVAGYNCSLLLDSTGGVWTCGQDNGGNLGGNAGGATLTAMKDSAGKFTQIKKIASPILTTYDTDAGNLHTVFLDEYGCVWTVGSNSKGQLAGGGSSSAVGRISCNSSDKATTDVRVEVVFDITPPVINGIEDGSTNTEAKSFTVTDDYGVASVTINGEEATKDGESYKTNESGAQTIIAKDNSGNTTTVSINKNAATIGFTKDDKISVTYDKGAVTAGTATTDDIQYAYDGDTNVPTITATWYKKNESDEYEKLTGAPKDVGSYKVVISAATTDKYFAAKAEKEFEITRANATLKFTKDGEESITYTGNKVKAGLASDEDANTYDITYSYDGDGEVTATWYGSSGDAKGNELENNTPPTEVGTYYLVITASEGKNYNAVTGVEKKVTITKATAEITINEIEDITYSGSAVTAALASAGDTSQKNITYTYKGDSDNITVKWYKDNDGSKGDALENSKVPTDAGTYWIGVSATEGTNYTAAAEATKQFKIAKKDANLAFADSKEYTTTYNNSAVTVGEGSENIKYTYDGDGNVTATWYKDSVDASNKLQSAPEDAGTYYVVLTASAGDNYKAVTEGPSKKVTINKAAAEIKINDIAGITYSGKAVTVGESSADITYSHTGDVTIGTDNIKWYDSSKKELSEAPKDAGTYYIGLTAAQGTNYEAVTTEVQKQFKIAPYDISSTNISKSIEIKASTDTLEESTIAGVNDETVSGTYVYEYTTSSGITRTTLGKEDVIKEFIARANDTYTVSVRFTAKSGSNYTGTATGTISVKVNKPTPEITFTGLNGITYDGDAVKAGKTGTTGVDITYSYSGSGAATVTWCDASGNALTNNEAPTAAGTYKIKVYVAPTSTYNEAEATGDFTIDKATATITFDEPGTITYGTAVKAGTKGTTGADIIYTYVGDNPSFTTTWYGSNGDNVGSALSAAPTDAGTYYVGISAAAGDNYGAVTKQQKFTISQADASITINKPGTITYDGSAVEALVNGTSGADITYKQVGDGTVEKKWFKDNGEGDPTELESAPKDAGDYIVKISAKASQNYKAAAEQTQSFTISPKTVTGTIEDMQVDIKSTTKTLGTPTSITDIDAEAKAGICTYSYEGKTTEADILTALKASDDGTYDVTITFKPTSNNYTGTLTGTIKATVARAEAQITFTKYEDITYDGSVVTAGTANTNDIKYNYTGNSSDVTIEWYKDKNESLSDKISNGAPKDAGTYWVKVSAAATTDYKAASAQQKFTISPKTVTGTIPEMSINVTSKTGTLGTPTAITGIDEEAAEGTYTYSYSEKTSEAEILTALKAADDGAYDVTITFKPTSANYTGTLTGTIKATVARTNAEITFTKYENITYDGSEVTAGTADTNDIQYNYTGDSSDVTIEWYKDNSGNLGDEITSGTPKDAGTYWVKVSAAATTDYKAVSVQQKFTISPKTVTGTIPEMKVAIKSTTETLGTPNTITGIDSEAAEGTYTYSYGEKISEADILTALKASNDGTYDVTITFKPTSTNYTGTLTGTIKATVARTEAQITFTKYNNITYDGSGITAGTTDADDIKYNYTGDNSSVTVKWYKDNSGDLGDEITDGTPTDAGTYWVKASATQTLNYKAVEKTQKFTISQADASITINQPGAITYDESPVVADVEGTSGADITYTKIGDGNVVIEWYKGNNKLDTAPTDAGNYIVKISANAGKNYKAAAEQTQNFTISRKAASITINEPSAITYSGNAVTVGTAGAYITYSYMGDGEITTTWYGSKEQDAIDTTKSSTTAPKDAGVYYVGIKAAAGANYAEVAEQFKKFTISKATASITIADPGTITYDGNAVKAGKADVADADIKYIQVGDGEPVIEWFKDNESAEDEKLTSAPKDAGKYIVKISANSSTNYLPVAEQTKTFTILPATASITINDPGTINYDGEVVTIGKVGAAGTTGTTEGTAATTYDITYNYDGDNDIPTITWYSCDSEGNKSGALTEAPKTAGTYYVGVSAAATNNYKEVTEVTQKFTIVQKSSYGGGGSGAATPSTDTSKNSGSENVVNTNESKKTDTPATTTATITNTTATTTTTPATGDKEATTTTTITSTVDTTTANKIVEKAVENKSKEVVIDAQTSTTDSQASSTAGSTEASGTTTTEVTIPTTTITQLSEKTSAEIVIKTNDANITLDKKTVAAITKQINEESKASDDEQPSDTADQGKTDASTATGETTTVASTLKLTVTTVEQGKSSVKFDVKIETASGEVKSFKGGKVTVTVNLNSEIASKKHLICVYINDHNVYSRISGKKNADGTFTFTTKHFSTYAIMTEEEVDKIIAEQTAEVKALEDKIQLKASSAKTSKGNVKVTLRVSKGTSSLKKLEDLGYTVKYRFYRSTKKSSGYKAMTTKASKTYINMNGKKGTRYYYKARVMVYDSEGTLVASTAFKQCKYATRQWTKK